MEKKTIKTSYGDLTVQDNGEVYQNGKKLDQCDEMYDADTDLSVCISPHVNVDDKGSIYKKRVHMDELMEMAGYVQGSKSGMKNPTILHKDHDRNNYASDNLEWVEKDKKITVRLAKTYATTMKYRTSGKSIRSVIVNGQEIDISDRLNEMFGSNGSDIWLSQFNTYKNLFQKTPDGTAASHYATSIYKLCKKPDSLDVAEKEIVAAEIKKLKAKTEDDFIRNLFDMSIERLKK